MKYVYGRPLGLWAIAFVITADGVSLLGASIELLPSAPTEWFAIVISSAIGALLLLKAYRLLCFHYTTRIVVMVASGIGAAIHTLEIVRGHGNPGVWLAVTWALVTIVYLRVPAVHGQFIRHRV